MRARTWWLVQTIRSWRAARRVPPLDYDATWLDEAIARKERGRQ